MPAVKLRKLDTTVQSWLHLSQAIVMYVFRLPHSCQVGALLSALCHCHRPVAFTGAIHALEALSAPVKQYTGSWLAVFGGTAA